MLQMTATLSPRAASFVQVHGVRIPTWAIEQHKDHWGELGRPVDAVKQLIEHQRRWGGLVLPPASEYEGGPYDLDADDPDFDDDGLVFSVGRPRFSMPYASPWTGRASSASAVPATPGYLSMRLLTAGWRVLRCYTRPGTLPRRYGESLARRQIA